jgi:type II secretory pathway pseudopilin PulG
MKRTSREGCRAFTILELLVATAVLALMVGVIAQLMGAASSSAELAERQLDRDAQARLAFGRMAVDFGQMGLMKNQEILLAKSARDPSGAGLNDKLFFYSATPGAGAAPASGAGAGSGVSLVAYRVHADAQGPMGLERLAKGLAWHDPASGSGPRGISFLTYPLATGTIFSATPAIASTMVGRWPATMGAAPDYHGADPDFRSLCENVFRLEFCFQLKDGTVSNYPVARPAEIKNSDPGISDDSEQGYTSGSRWFNERDGRAFRCVSSQASAAVWEPVGFGEVASVIVSLAVFDADTWKALPSRGGLTDALPDVTDADLAMVPPVLPLVKWNAAIESGAFASDAMKARAARVYQRDFAIH